MSSKTEVWAWIPLESTGHFRWYVTLLNCENHWIISKGTNALLFINGIFRKISTVQILRQKETKKYWKQTTNFWWEVSNVFKNLSSKRQLTFCFDIRKERVAFVETNLKGNDVKNDIIGVLPKVTQNILNRMFDGEKGKMSRFIRCTIMSLINPMQLSSHNSGVL